MTASMTSWSSRSAAIATDLGRIELPQTSTTRRTPCSRPATAGSRVRVDRGAEPVVGRGYGNEIVEVGRCLREGLRESPLVPHEQTMTLMRQMDDLRAQVGVAYAADGR